MGTQAPISQTAISLEALRTITSPIGVLPFSSLAEAAHVATVNLEIRVAKQELNEKEQIAEFKEVVTLWMGAMEKMKPVTPQHLISVLETCLNSLKCLRESASL